MKKNRKSTKVKSPTQWPELRDQAKEYVWVGGNADLRIASGCAYVNGALHWVYLKSGMEPIIKAVSHHRAAAKMLGMIEPEIEFELDQLYTDEGHRQWLKDLSVLLAGVQSGSVTARGMKVIEDANELVGA